MEESPEEHYVYLMKAMEPIVPIIANHKQHTCEEVITAIAKVLRLKGMTMEVLRDTSIGSYVRELLDHYCVQVHSAALIALDCFETTLFDWAESVDWSRSTIRNECLDADRKARQRAYVAVMNTCGNCVRSPVESVGSQNDRPGSNADGDAAKNGEAEVKIASPKADQYDSTSSEELKDSSYSPTQESKRSRTYWKLTRHTPPVTRRRAHG